MQRKVGAFSIVAASILLGTAAFAADEGSPVNQAHFRSGLINGKSSGIIEQSIDSPSPLEMEYEYFTSLRSSFTIRGLVGYSTSKGRVNYFAAAVGRRYYLWSAGTSYAASEHGVDIQATPKWKYFTGFEGGLAELQVSKVGSVLQVNTTQIELGPHIGVAYQINKSFSAELVAGGSYGFGISDVAVNTLSTRFLVGIAWYL